MDIHSALHEVPGMCDRCGVGPRRTGRLPVLGRKEPRDKGLKLPRDTGLLIESVTDRRTLPRRNAGRAKSFLASSSGQKHTAAVYGAYFTIHPDVDIL